MLSSVNSPSVTQDDHLRLLLDQRAARADLHGHNRFPSLSEFSDTPSVYSRAFFSPRPMENVQFDANPSSRFRSPLQWSSPHDLRSKQDRMDDPAVSVLDMDEDPRTSFLSTATYDDDDHSPSQGPSEEDDDSLPRMSLLGPKMRVHSRAPWEVDDALEEEDESDHSGNPIPAVNAPVHTIKKVFKMSPSSSGSERPSTESAHSQGKPKASFETTSSYASQPRIALQALAQASLSSTSLLAAGSPSVPTTLRKKISDVLRSQSPRSKYTPSCPSSPSPRDPSVPCFSSNPASRPSEDNRLDTTIPLTRLNTASEESSNYNCPRDEGFHPYANPDLALSYPDSSPSHSSHDLSGVSRSDSVATVVDSNAVTSHYTQHTNVTVIAETPGHDQKYRHRLSTLQGKGISSPVSIRHPDSSPTNDVRDPKFHPHLQPNSAVNNLPGWIECSVSPSFNLISLEEAKAQRSRSATVHNPSIHSISTPSRHANEIDVDQDARSATNSFDRSPSGSVTSRTRARSISTGAKAKQALQSMVGSNAPTKLDRRDSEPAVIPQQTTNGGFPGKTLKHKRSGFMRLFNGRDKDREPPPVPSLSDGVAAFHAHQNVAKPPRPSPHRVPVPHLSPAFLEGDSGISSHEHSDSSVREGYDASLEASPIITSRKPSNNPRHTPPLSINTSASPGSHGTVPYQARTAPSSSVSDRSWKPSPVPQSAPAHVTEFPALKLRPVSTQFSAHFTNHILPAEPSLELDSAISPTSTAPFTSPITPNPLTRSDKTHSDPGSGDQLPVIRALQEQIVTAKQAWQRQIWELEGQVRDLKAEIEDLRAVGKDKGYCEVCGRGKQTRPSESGDGDSCNTSSDAGAPRKGGIVNRPRARTGNSSRFGCVYD